MNPHTGCKGSSTNTRRKKMDYKVANVVVDKELRKNRRETLSNYQKLMNKRKIKLEKEEKQDA